MILTHVQVCQQPKAFQNWWQDNTPQLKGCFFEHILSSKNGYNSNKKIRVKNTFIVQKCVQQSNHLYSLRYTQSSGKVPQACHQACPPPHTCPRTAWQPWSTRGAACSVQTRTATSCAVSLPERNLAAAPAGTDPRCYSQTTQSLSTSACWWLTRTLTKPASIAQSLLSMKLVFKIIFVKTLS